jgi:4-hydroxybenzoate polyprenyltransferase
MNRITAFIKLIRLPNLLIIALAQYAIRWGVIFPMYSFINRQLFQNFPGRITNPDIVQLQVSEFYFFLLSLATVMIAAAGYIINDYFDVNIDRINKPLQIIIGKTIKRREAMLAHITISGFAIVMAVFVSFKLGLWQYSLIYVACAFGLWFYSTEFKKQFLTGNIVVAFFVALVPFIAGLFELHLTAEKYHVLRLPPFEVNFKFIFDFIVGFSTLGFLINLIREIIKDIEDMDGDKTFGCQTLPITLGLETSKNIVSFLIIVLMFIIGYIQKGQFDSGAKISFIYLLLFIQVPLAGVIYLVQKASVAKDFKMPDILSKAVMLSGLLYTFLIYFSFMNYG